MKIMSNSDIKIFLAYHKPDILFQSDILTPIQVGRKCAINKANNIYGDNNLAQMISSMIGDDTGENISDKNPSYNEMTGVYWVWKNYENIGNPSYVGFMHYRRHFIFKDLPNVYYECNEVQDNHITETICCNEVQILDTLKKFDFIVSKPYYRSSIYDHYKENHKIEDLDLAIEILKKRYPEYSNACDKYINGSDAYFCNMFVFPKDIFFKYCEWIFNILDEFEMRVDITGKRLFISERLTGIFIQELLDSGKTAKFYPTLYIEENVTIPIAMAMDMAYLLPASVAITSMLENAKKSTNYDIYIMVKEEMKKYAQLYFEPIRNKYSNCKINIVDMKKIFSDIKMSISHITFQTYYRLFLPSILKKYNKCIYLDSDIIVNSDLTSFFRTNIDEYLLAGVKAAGYYYPETKVKKHMEITGIKKFDQYINAGVLLMNLKRMREENLEKLFFDLAQKCFPSQDQDVLNIACWGNIRILPLQYNLMTKYFSNKGGIVVADDYAERIYSKDEIKVALEKPIIIHYADRSKPWGKYVGIKGEIWEKYESICPVLTERENNKISIIVPSYNVESYIKQSINSIQNQVLKKLDIIIINDGSTDNTFKIVDNVFPLS